MVPDTPVPVPSRFKKPHLGRPLKMNETPMRRLAQNLAMAG